MRAQHHVWAQNFLIRSENIRLGFEEVGFVELGPESSFSVFTFSWLGTQAEDFTSYNSLCLTIDKQHPGNIRLMVNGETVLNEEKALIKNLTLAPGKS